MGADEARYERAASQAEEEHEGRCLRCGICCGRDNDPCSKLRRQADGTYLCTAYAHRFGWQETVTGKTFRCVPIRDLLKMGACPRSCGYRYGVSLRRPRGVNRRQRGATP